MDACRLPALVFVLGDFLAGCAAESGAAARDEAHRTDEGVDLLRVGRFYGRAVVRRDVEELAAAFVEEVR